MDIKLSYTCRYSTSKKSSSALKVVHKICKLPKNAHWEKKRLKVREICNIQYWVRFALNFVQVSNNAPFTQPI